MNIQEKGAELRRLHDDPALLQLVNVWDVASARVIAGLPGTRALATASHSIAAMYGYRGRRAHPARPHARSGFAHRRRHGAARHG